MGRPECPSEFGAVEWGRSRKGETRMQVPTQPFSVPIPNDIVEAFVVLEHLAFHAMQQEALDSRSSLGCGGDSSHMTLAV